MIQPSILPGFMELLPKDQIAFNHIHDVIEKTFQKYAFLPIDTPIIEKTEILLAKGGGETQKQIYRVEKGSRDMSLRFDLTVPLARYVAQHYNELNFPFRRYQIGKVYRGERNQKGRFREFYQCDIDIIGNESLSLYNDAEIPAVIYEVFARLGLEDVTLCVNNRKLINGFFEAVGIEDSVGALRIVDKLAKIGREKVVEELQELGTSIEAIERLMDWISSKGTNDEILTALEDGPMENENYAVGFQELKDVYRWMQEFGIPEKNIRLDLSITRGLDYYTGSVFETFIDGHEDIGSVCSGGRYDDLAQNFTNRKLPGIGLSIGLTRLYYQLNESGLLPPSEEAFADVMVLPMEGCVDYGMEILKMLREQNIRTQIYLEGGKMKKMMAYADKMSFPFVVVCGENEKNTGTCSLRNMATGEQSVVPKERLTECLN